MLCRLPLIDSDGVLHGEDARVGDDECLVALLARNFLVSKAAGLISECIKKAIYYNLPLTGALTATSSFSSTEPSSEARLSKDSASEVWSVDLASGLSSCR